MDIDKRIFTADELLQFVTLECEFDHLHWWEASPSFDLEAKFVLLSDENQALFNKKVEEAARKFAPELSADLIAMPDIDETDFDSFFENFTHILYITSPELQQEIVVFLDEFLRLQNT